MDKALNSAGYDLYEITKDEWILDTNNGPIFHGTLKKVALYAIRKLGFKVQDFEIATEELVKNPTHNAVHFGMYKTFMFTFNRDFNGKTSKVS
jgi:hypothetical protein